MKRAWKLNGAPVIWRMEKTIMAKTIAKAIGMDSTRIKNVHRLGSKCAEGQANTYRTFTTCYVSADGSGYVHVERDGKMLHNFTFGPEE